MWLRRYLVSQPVERSPAALPSTLTGSLVSNIDKISWPLEKSHLLPFHTSHPYFLEMNCPHIKAHFPFDDRLNQAHSCGPKEYCVAGALYWLLSSIAMGKKWNHNTTRAITITPTVLRANGFLCDVSFLKTHAPFQHKTSLFIHIWNR